MATTRVPREMIIEALTEKNYKSWAECMKNYLMGKGLWDDIVNCSDSKPEHEPDQMKHSSTDQAASLWGKRNAKALHAIQVSCGPKMFSYIIKEDSAKAAWDSLASFHRWHDQHKTAVQIQLERLNNKGILDENMSLYNAVINGNCEETNTILKQHPEAVRAKISTDGGTALHNAILSKNDKLVKLLVEKMNDKDLEAKCQNGATALHIVASGSSVEVAKAMVKKNKDLLCLRNTDGYIPVCVAALYGGSEEMLEYLSKVTPHDMLSNSSGATLLSILMNNENYAFALELLDRFPKLAITINDKRRICLNILAQKPSSVADGTQFSTLQRWIYERFNIELTNHRPDRVKSGPNKWNDIGDRGYQSLWSRILCKILSIDKLYESKVKHIQAKEILKRIFEQLRGVKSIESLESLVMPAMFQAVEAENVEFIIEMLNFYPALLKSRTQLGCIFHKAVAKRKVRIWTLIHSLPEVMRHDIASMKDDIGNNLSHVAASVESGLEGITVPALRMYRELRSFKEVEKLLPTMLKEKKNKEAKTAETVFTEQHSEMAKEGKRWMEEMATSCTVVATLIISVMFSGANHSWLSNIPVATEIEYISGFHIFMMADALSVVSSTLALLTFLSIFTIGYAQKDFLEALPQRFKMSLATLFFSIGTVMVAFGVLFFDKLSSAQKWGALAFSSLSMVPVAFFAGLHIPVLLEMIKYPFRSSNFASELQLLFRKDSNSPLQIRRRTFWKLKYS